MTDSTQYTVLLHWSDNSLLPLISQAADWLIENNIKVITGRELRHDYTAKMIIFTDPELALIFKLRFNDLIVSEKFLQEKFPPAV